MTYSQLAFSLIYCMLSNIQREEESCFSSRASACVCVCVCARVSRSRGNVVLASVMENIPHHKINKKIFCVLSCGNSKYFNTETFIWSQIQKVTRTLR